MEYEFMLGRIWRYAKRNRRIVIQFIKRETISRYKGSFFGLLWSVLTPLFMLVVYTFVFGEIFQAKWHTQSSRLEFAMIIFCGLTTFNIFGEVISRSPNLIVQHTNYVKKVVFPLEVFPIIAVGTALVNAAINFGLLILFIMVTTGGLSWTVLLLPLALLPLLLFTTGLSWVLSALGVYIRDISHVISIGVQALMLLSPIFYSVDVIPERFVWFYQANPITHFVEDIRSILIWGKIPQINSFLMELLLGAFIFLIGIIWFRKTKHGFADVV